MSPANAAEIVLREGILEVCQRLHQRNLLAAADGNVSFRLSDDRILITPSGRPKAFLEIKDLAVITLDNEVIAGSPSAERLLHLAVYRHCPEAKAVVHAHPPTAIAWSLARPELKELPAEALPEVILAAGRIPFVPYARPTTSAMAEVLKPFLPAHRLLILSRHGGLSWGESLEEAYMGMERLEHASHILALAEGLGGAKPVSEGELNALRALRTQIGTRLL